MSGYIDKEGLLEDLGLLLEETQTKTGCSFSDDIPYGEVLACIEGNAISVEYTEQDVRDAFNDGYSCGKEESADAVPVVRCKDCKYAHLTYDGECKYCDAWSGGEPLYLDGDFYCSFGEKVKE